MRRRPIVLVVGIALGALFVAAGLLRDYANTIDNVHWIGSPLPPCFLWSAMEGA